eukprot:s451_g2.t1
MEEYCLKAFCSFLAAAGALTVAILEPTCGYAGHQKCYTDCFGVPGVHFLLWLVPSIGSVLFLNLLQMCCPDQAILPPILCWKPKPPPEPPVPPAPLPPVPEPEGANHQKPPAGTASASTTTPAQSEGSVKQKFRKNLVAGLKDPEGRAGHGGF